MTLPTRARRRVVAATLRIRAALTRQRLRARPWQERRLLRQLDGRTPVSTLTNGPLVSVIVVGRRERGVPEDLRAALDQTAYHPIEIRYATATGGADARSVVLAAEIERATGELVCLFDPAALPTRSDWLGHLVESVLGGAVGAGPLVVRARGRGPVRAAQHDPDLGVLSAGIDLARASGVALPAHIDVGADPVDLAGRVVPIPAIALAGLVARRSDLLAASIPEGYRYDGIEQGPTAAPLADADLCLRLRQGAGTVVRDARAILWYRTALGPPVPARPPKPPRPGLPVDPDRARFLDRWGPRLAREVLSDVISARHLWSLRPLRVAVVGEAPDILPDGPPAGLDWVIDRGSALEATNHPDADLVICAGRGPDVRGTPPGLIRVAWLPDGEPEWLPEFDLIVAPSESSATRLGGVTGKPVAIADLRAPGAGDALQRALLDWVGARRLAIRIGASNWPNAPTWGDYHFGRMLQRALERAGYPTRLRLLRDWTSDAAARDDATIHVFGLFPAINRSSQVNVLWQISHPDLASAELYDSYDLVFVASDPFAEQMAALARGPVVALHQATDPDRFRPEPGGPAHDLLYVANQRDERPIVNWLIPTERDLAVYGRGWAEHGLDPRHHRAEHVPNDQLHRFYASAAIVLNDTWADMRAAGFIPNRIYDALASGGFVLSDDVAGLDAEFDGAVPTYADRDELRAAIERFLADPGTRRDWAARGRAVVLGRHTFAHRAETLAAAIEPLLATRPARIAEDRSRT